MSGASIDGTAFRSAFDRFRALVEATSGHPFRSFDEGLAAAWEDYKPRLRDHALGLLRPGDWLEGEIGSGAVLKRTVEAIEIQDSRLNLTNNLVFWQNRFGHANRDHRAMLEAASNPALRGAIERLLFGLYRGVVDEGATFDGLVDATGGKYPLLAYLFTSRTWTGTCRSNRPDSTVGFALSASSSPPCGNAAGRIMRGSTQRWTDCGR